MLALSSPTAQFLTPLTKIDLSSDMMPAAPPQTRTFLSSSQLTYRITTITQNYLSSDVLQAHIQQPVLRPVAMPVPSLQEIGTEYGLTCTLIWQTLWRTIERPFPSNDALLDAQIQQLCLLWAHAKRYSADADFFANSPTLFSGLQTKWTHTSIKLALRHATIQLQSDPLYQDTLAGFSTCWAYLLGCVMSQLLQWNHQLTPHILRELWPVDIHPVLLAPTPFQH